MPWRIRMRQAYAPPRGVTLGPSVASSAKRACGSVRSWTWLSIPGSRREPECHVSLGTSHSGYIGNGIAVRRLHIGGQVRTAGWEVLDANPGPCVDHVGNAADLTRFEAGIFKEVYASHVLEHFDYKDELLATLKEWHRVLVPGGMLHVSVPDMDVLARLFLDRQRLSTQDRFLVMRMIFGGHLDRYDYHAVGLNEEFLRQYLSLAGFATAARVPEFGICADTSMMTLMDTPISLNMTALKGAI
jgi:predicted SAM-dependent methyltransferase